jgi:hypothetical protein
MFGSRRVARRTAHGARRDAPHDGWTAGTDDNDTTRRSRRLAQSRLAGLSP